MKTRMTKHTFAQTIILALLLSLMSACWPTEDPSPLRVRMIYSLGGKGDMGWNDQGYLGLIEARKNDGASIIEASPLSVEEAATSFFRWLADPSDGYRELVIAHSTFYEDFVEQAQCFFGSRKVILFEGNVTDCGAVKVIQYRTFPVAFRAGFAAMRASETKKLGIIVGAAIPSLQEMAEGFRAGANYAASRFNYANASCNLHYIPPALNGLTHPAEATKWANIYWDKDIDIIFALSGSSNFAIIETAKVATGRRVLGADVDQSVLGQDVVLGSVVRRNDLTIARLVNAMWKGALGGGLEVVDESSGEVGIVPNAKFKDLFSDLDEDTELATEAATATNTYLGVGL
jgi:basic membrane protein A